MEVVEDTLGVELDAFLARPLCCFLAQVADAGPRVSPLWYHWRDETAWLIAQRSGRSYPDRVARDPRVALAVVDFDPAIGRVEHVGMRGRASLEPYDADLADRLLRRYLGDDPATWPAGFRDLSAEGYDLIRVAPETVVARDQSYPAPQGGGR